jgi:hypothetical protein
MPCESLIDISFDLIIVHFFSVVAVVLACQTYVLPNPYLTKAHAQVIDHNSEIKWLDNALVGCYLSQSGKI